MHSLFGTMSDLLLLNSKLGRMLAEDDRELIATFASELLVLKEDVARLKAQKKHLVDEKKSHMALLSEFLTTHEATCIPIKVRGKICYICCITEKRHRGIGDMLL